MRHLAITLALLAGALLPAGAYIDHRGHNVDSLERVVAPWTPEAIDKATEEELIDLNRSIRTTMYPTAIWHRYGTTRPDWVCSAA